VQASAISWARETARLQTDPLKRQALELYHAIPNGAAVIRMQKPIINRKTGRPLPPREALKLIAEGLTRGIEDTCLNWTLRDSFGHITCAGFYIEYKQPGKYPTKEQRAVMEFHRQMGYRAEWFTSPRSAALAIVEHMGLEKYGALPVERLVVKEAA
jgi:hypothetical protein